MNKGSFYEELQKLNQNNLAEYDIYNHYFSLVYELCDLKDVNMDTIVFKYCGKGYSELKLLEFLMNKKIIKNIIFFDIAEDKTLIPRTLELIQAKNYTHNPNIEFITTYKDYFNILNSLNTTNIMLIGLQPYLHTSAIDWNVEIGAKRTAYAKTRAKYLENNGNYFMEIAADGFRNKTIQFAVTEKVAALGIPNKPL